MRRAWGSLRVHRGSCGQRRLCRRLHQQAPALATRANNQHRNPELTPTPSLARRQMLINDVARILAIYVCALVGFSIAFHVVLFADGPCPQHIVRRPPARLLGPYAIRQPVARLSRAGITGGCSCC